jgi:hypothetical protein
MPNQIEREWISSQVPKLAQSRNQPLSEGGTSSFCPLFGQLLENCPQQSQIAQNA